MTAAIQPNDATIQPEEVHLCILCHYFVDPPAQSMATGELFAAASCSQRLAMFLLKQIQVRRG